MADELACGHDGSLQGQCHECCKHSLAILREKFHAQRAALERIAEDQRGRSPAAATHAEKIALEALAPSVTGSEPRTAALATFAEWFVKNYPGPDTIIHDPNWHAPRIFRAVEHALRAESPASDAHKIAEENDRADAERYRFLRSEMARLDRLAAVVVKRRFDRSGHEWAEIVDLDCVIDSLIVAHAVSAPPPPAPAMGSQPIAPIAQPIETYPRYCKVCGSVGGGCVSCGLPPAPATEPEPEPAPQPMRVWKGPIPWGDLAAKCEECGERYGRHVIATMACPTSQPEGGHT